MIAGLILGAVCVGGALLLAPPTEASIGIIIYILFGYPAYVLLTVPPKGIVLGGTGSSGYSMRIRNREYFDDLRILNSSLHDAPAETRLAGDKGVWRH